MPDTNDMMAAYAADAVGYAAKLKKQLDYSVESVVTLEKICDILHKAIPKTLFARFFLFKRKPSDKKIQQYAIMLGGYLGEVIRKNHGGKWSIENFEDHANTIVLNTAGLKIFVVGKVYLRLKKGMEHNLPEYYAALSAAVISQ